MATNLCHRLLTTREAATFLGITVHELTELRRKRTGPDWVKLGRTIRYTPDDLNWWLGLTLLTPRERGAWLNQSTHP